jgi:hypothetical protein
VAAAELEAAEPQRARMSQDAALEALLAPLGLDPGDLLHASGCRLVNRCQLWSTLCDVM